MPKRVHVITSSRYMAGFALFTLTLIALVVLFTAAPATTTVYAGANAAAPRLPAAQSGAPAIRFASGVFNIDEGDSGTANATINVQASPAPTQTVTVQYTTVNGTATAGVDYTTASGTLTFNAGETLKSFTVSVIGDTLTEPDETVTLVLQNPTNSVLGNPNIAQLIIENDDNPTATPTRTGAAATPIYADIYEANDTFETATTLIPNSTQFCDATNATLWPANDLDVYRFWGKPGSVYNVETRNLAVGLDTVITLYGTQGELIATNDDFNSRASRVFFEPKLTGYHYLTVINKDPGDPANKTYCVDIDETSPTVVPTNTPQPTSTPVPTGTRVPGADRCEVNNNFNQACTIGTGVSERFNFVPQDGTGPDNDFFRLWVKPGTLYACETLNLSALNDTNMIMYDQNQNGIGGNDDKVPGDLGSSVSFRATYTGWLYVLVGPVAIPQYGDSASYEYDLACTADAATPTPTPRPITNTGGGTGFVPQATATPAPTIDIQGTIDASIANLAPTPTLPPVINIVPLPTATMAGAAVGATVDLTILLYYDENQNQMPELNEGIMDMAISIYDGTTGQLLNIGYTNEAGMLRFGIPQSVSVVRVSVPFLGISQTVAVGTPEVRIRVVPQPLPSGIP